MIISSFEYSQLFKFINGFHPEKTSFVRAFGGWKVDISEKGTSVNPMTLAMDKGPTQAYTLAI